MYNKTAFRSESFLRFTFEIRSVNGFFLASSVKRFVSNPEFAFHVMMLGISNMNRHGQCHGITNASVYAFTRFIFFVYALEANAQPLSVFALQDIEIPRRSKSF